jgi:protein TonB
MYVPSQKPLLDSSAAELRTASIALVDVVVLSPDLALFEAIRDAVGERNPVWRARSAEEAVDLLLTGRCGVFLVDMAAVSNNPASLIEQITEQFPDVVSVVAGRRDDEALLARLISDGLIYRFMHKPLSPKRAGMFLNAAIRHHAERRLETAHEPLLQLGPLVPKFIASVELPKWLFVTAGVGLFVGLAAVVWNGSASVSAARKLLTPAVAPVVAPLAKADPVLASARAAFAAGRYESPPGRNALDLYQAVLLARPDQPEAREGLQKTVSALLEQAEYELAAGRVDEAERLVTRALLVVPDDPGMNAMAVRLKPSLPPAPVGADPLPEAGIAAQASTAPEAARSHAQRLPAAPEVRPAAAPVDTGRPEDPPHAGAVPVTPVTPVGPVTPVTPVSVPVTRQAASDGSKRETPRAAPIVRPDPLLASMVQHKYTDARPRSAKPAPAPRSATVPAGPRHDIAGIENAPQPPVSAASPGERSTGPQPFQTSAPLLPLGDLQRVSARDPVYPPQALRERIEGWVEIEFLVTESGAVDGITVLDARPAGVFEEAATRALSDWVFRPRVVNGQPVPMRSVITMRFNVDG